MGVVFIVFSEIMIESNWDSNGLVLVSMKSGVILTTTQPVISSTNFKMKKTC